MVKKNALEKLRDKELEKYIQKDSRFVSEAVQFAYELLIQRGRNFTESEIADINTLIESKKEKEKIPPPPENGWDKNLVEDQSALKLYTNKLIWFFSILFGVIFGTALQVYNYAKIKNYKGLIMTLTFGILYTIFQIYTSNYLEENPITSISPRYSSTIFLSMLGAAGLFMIRDYIMPIKIQYQSKSFVFPLVLAIVVYILIFLFQKDI